LKQELLDFIAALDASRDFDTAWATTVSFFGNLGQPWMCYGHVRRGAPASEAGSTVRTNLPTQFLDGWVSEEFHKYDPLYQHILASPLPGTFGAEYVDRAQNGEEVYQYYEEARSVGTASNLTVPLGNARAGGRRFLISGGPRNREDFERFLRDHGDLLISAIHYADAHMFNLLEAEGLKDVQITPREVECLQWLSEGHMNDRIAEKMKVSEVTVRLHLTNIRRKLKSATREQALVKALKLGLIYA
jgi:DNA-binding CsgD family transcriptional regulator